ncbi:MAG: alanine racemase domain protein, partial [Solirubrobacterales bacterium]|nr:alanine racemase domain protein [Solirubrobacterales bacterium]
VDALGRLRSAGLQVPVLNAPSATCSATVAMLAAAGATHVEPGSCLTGQTPLHAVSDEPELPAMIYVSEVTHALGDTVFTLGGGFYPRSRAAKALIYGRSASEPIKARAELDPPDAIDYYGNLHVDDADPSAVHVGDTVVYAFRAQVFVSRCFVAVVEGVGTNPTVVGLFDRGGFELGDDLLPVSARAYA